MVFPANLNCSLRLHSSGIVAVSRCQSSYGRRIYNEPPKIIKEEVQAERAWLQACYALKSSVERMWKRIPREADDYIANPKGFGGYQSLHTAVTGKPFRWARRLHPGGSVPAYVLCPKCKRCY